MTTLHVLGNPSRGTDHRAFIAAYEHKGLDVVDVTASTADGSSAALGTAVEDRDVERLIIAGGDGLVHLGIQHVAGTSIPVGILPSGTGNDFSTALGIVEPNIDATLGEATPVDLIELRDRDGSSVWVASIAIIGFPAAINARANRIPMRLGKAVYTLAAALELPRFTRTKMRLAVDGHERDIDSAMLAIGNTRFFGGGMLACPDARHDDGLLHLTSIEGVGRVGILRHLAQKSGGTADRPEVLRLTAERIELLTPEIDIWGDGEPVGLTPLRAQIRRGALLVAGVEGTPEVSSY